jgi:threonine aldolase
VLSLTEATEARTVYRPEEVAALGEIAHARGLAVHMDGARFANAVAALGCRPADITWRASVDMLSFGATKNGALGAEAVVDFRPPEARPGHESLRRRRMRGGHLLSKMRYVSAQLEAYLTGDLWLDLARRANAAAARLARGLEGVPGVALVHPVEANELFVRLPARVAEALAGDGIEFHRWPGPGSAEGYAEASADDVIRLVVPYCVEEDAVAHLIARARAHAAAAGR